MPEDPRCKILRDGMFAGWVSDDPSVEKHRAEAATAKLAELDQADPLRCALDNPDTELLYHLAKATTLGAVRQTLIAFAREIQHG